MATVNPVSVPPKATTAEDTLQRKSRDASVVSGGLTVCATTSGALSGGRKHAKLAGSRTTCSVDHVGSDDGSTIASLIR